MAAPTADIDICNLALDLLKQNKTVVADIDSPTSEEEITCARWYDATREALLRSHFWWFARKRRAALRHRFLIINITQANPCVVTTSATHDLANGDEILIADVLGMTEVNDISYFVANVTATTFELNDVRGLPIDSTDFTAFGTALTGTIDPAASTTVTGVGTLFSTELEVNDWIRVTGETRQVKTITSATVLVVYNAFTDNANDTSPDKIAGTVVPYNFGLYQDAYVLPSDFLRLQFIGDDSINNYYRNYEINDDEIIMSNGNADSLDIGYIANVTDVTKFDPLFLLLFAHELANNMAYKWTLKNTVIKRLEEQLFRLRAEARTVCGQDVPPKRVQRSKFIDARRRCSTTDAGKYTYFD